MISISNSDAKQIIRILDTLIGLSLGGGSRGANARRMAKIVSIKLRRKLEDKSRPG
nr:MAG TPA: hypothetical protein [Caudoviricetes sp.]